MLLNLRIKELPAMKNHLLLLFLSVMTGFMMGCHHDADLNFEPPRPVQAPDLLCAADTVYFQNTVFPLINSGCAKSGCHDADKHKAGIVLDSYSSIMEHVRPFDPPASVLYKMLYSNEDGRMPPDQPFTDEQKSIIYWWIKQGALNNRCDNILCDSSNVTYSGKIQPLASTWCVSCHNSITLSGGFSLETYDEMVTCANGGNLMGALRHETGYPPMPKNGMLPQCGIDLFQIWIDNGKPQ
jgi:hypothetical protein